ncbi:MAG: beta-galactosidase trimerization domain-containing protein, partial [Clostridia bacterium]|nr:beta-galactosidase trimerization domain-containing protein [Clostridia bacterium]
YCERIHPAEGAEVKAVYCRDFYANEPAVVENHYGKGTAIYIAARDVGVADSFKEKLLTGICKRLNIPSNLRSFTEGVTAHSRIDDENGIRYLFVENYTDKDAEVNIGSEAIDVETRERVKDTFVLPAYSIRILRQML